MKEYQILLIACLTIGIQARAEDKPTRLMLYIGGWDGPSYSIYLTNGLLVYKAGGGGTPDSFYGSVTQYLSPTAIQWAEFRQTLESIPLWNWGTNYIADYDLDGTQWTIDIAYSNRSIAIKGSNAYPGTTNILERTEEFNDYLSAVRRLINGNEFH
jgi:hypothetical protein